MANPLTRSGVVAAPSWMRAGAVAVLGLLASAAHFYLRTLPAETATPLMMLDRVFDAGVVIVCSLGWIGVGRRALYALGYAERSAVGDTVLAWGLGAGLTSHLLVLLGMMHVMSPPVVLLILAGMLALTVREWMDALGRLKRRWGSRTRLTRFERVVVMALAALILPVLLSALTPPIEGDALSYQLTAPAQFLARNAIVPLYDNTGANYPLGASLLFVFGLALGSPISAQLVHFAFGLALAGAVYAFTAENFSRPAGLLAMAILWTSPVIGLEASAPLVDLGWVMYEMMAVWMIWRWHKTRATLHLMMAGLALGFAVSSKYLAFVGWGTLTVFVLVDAWFGSGNNLGSTLRAVLLMTAGALLAASPWLVKNAVLLGNPVYPFFLGAYGFDGQLHKPTGATGGLGDWVAAGMGNDIGALVAFPYNVYIHWERFDPVKNRGGPSLFFWFLPFYLVVKKHPLINLIFALAVVRFAVWWNLTQFVRYGLILFPLLSIICAYIGWEVYKQVAGRWMRPAVRICIALFLIAGIVLEWGFLLTLREGSLAFLSGQTSQATFLDANLHDAQVTRFMNETLPQDARIFAVGDTRVFYLERQAIGDVSHRNWSDLATLGQDKAGVREQLRERGITHVWVSEDEIIYAENFWKIPPPWKNQTVPFDDFRERYLQEIYRDERGHTVFALHD